MPSWLWGAALNVAGSIDINLGTNLIKLSHSHRERALLTNRHPTPFYRSRIWLLGVICFVTGNIANFISFGFASQSLLSAMSSVQFVSNVIFSSSLCDEIITPRVLIATAWIVVGNCFIVLFANPNTKEYASDDLWMLYMHHDYLIYLSVLFVIVVASQILYSRIQVSIKLEGRHRDPAQSLLPILYALVSGIIGTQSVMLAKSASILLKTSIVDSNQMEDPTIYFVLVMWFLAMSFWLYRMNRALQKFDGLLIIPLLQVCWIVFSVVGGGIYFREFDDMSSGHTVGFTFGIIMIVFGVYLLSSQAPKRVGNVLEDPGSSQESVMGPDSADVSRRSSLITLLAPDMILSPRFEMAAGALVDASYRSRGQSFLQGSPKKSPLGTSTTTAFEDF